MLEYKYQMYRKLKEETAQIHEEARKAADEIGMMPELRGNIGLTGASSGCPAPLREDIIRATNQVSEKIVPLQKLMDEIRDIVKSVYGDEYDAAATNTCEAGLWVSYNCLFAPPIAGVGDNYRTRYILPYEKQLHYTGSYGRPFPPRYKDYLAERGGIAGELGSFSKRLNNLDTLLVPLVGAKYQVHGIKYHTVPLLLDVDAKASAAEVDRFAAMHCDKLSGLVSLGYDTVNYGYGEKAEDGSPLLQKLYSQIAKKYNIPYVVDNAWGMPFIGTDIRKTGADIMVYSMDKATCSDTSGLVIGKEEFMIPIRRALGMHGTRSGSTSAYSKSGFSAFDPGKHALASQIQALKVIRDNPKALTKPVDDLEKIVREEFEHIAPEIKAGITIEKSYNSRSIEINYENTWKDGKIGLPLFTMEDITAGTNLICSTLNAMGIRPSGANDGLISVSPDLGTSDAEGNLIPERARLAVRGLVRTLEIIAHHAEFI